jgi:hypothetical protein
LNDHQVRSEALVPGKVTSHPVLRLLSSLSDASTPLSSIIEMKSIFVLALVATAVTAFVVPQHLQNALKDQAPISQEKFMIELSPGETRWVTEDEKWALRRV